VSPERENKIIITEPCAEASQGLWERSMRQGYRQRKRNLFVGQPDIRLQFINTNKD